MAPQCGAFAIGREGHPAAAPGERLEHLAHAAESLDAVKVLVFVDLTLVVQDLLATACVESGSDNLKGLIAVQA